MERDELTYNDQGLIPCIVQDATTKDVLMMAWMNEESVRRTLEEKTTVLEQEPSEVLAQGRRVGQYPRARTAALRL